MLYNNPPAYRVNVVNACAERFALFAGLDDLVFDGITLGARGWVSGLSSAFPRESLALYEALRDGDLPRARRIYRWFMPLLHPDAEHDLVQSIKLAEQIMG
jgi:1-pyrroline-4-hydroxy-2-carboxylate deaminase